MVALSPDSSASMLSLSMYTLAFCQNASEVMVVGLADCGAWEGWG